MHSGQRLFAISMRYSFVRAWTNRGSREIACREAGMSRAYRYAKGARQQRIVDALAAVPSLRLNELVATLGVSGETIRRDLRELDARGLISRTYGGAVRSFVAEPALAERRRMMIDEREAIAAAVSATVEAGRGAADRRRRHHAARRAAARARPSRADGDHPFARRGDGARRQPGADGDLRAGAVRRARGAAGRARDGGVPARLRGASGDPRGDRDHRGRHEQRRGQRRRGLRRDDRLRRARRASSPTAASSGCGR